MSDRARQHNLNQQTRRKRATLALPQKDHSATIARIEELTKAARTSWFTMLGYLAFVGVTLMGVEDADFFIQERQTQLPLVGVSIPTFLFFWIAPLLGATLYAYFHVHLLKLFETLGETEATIEGRPISDKIAPWLVTDLALNNRPGALRARPLSGLSLGVTLLLSHLGMPALLAGMWWRSMPAHDEWLTMLGCGVPLFVATYTGLVSWGYLRQCMAAHNPLPRRATRLCLGVGLLTILTAFGWVRTEGTLGEGIEIMPTLLARADLAGVNFVDIPSGWQDHDVAEAEFFQKWCAARDIGSFACLSIEETAELDRDFILSERTIWCILRHQEETCSEIFAKIDDQRIRSWQIHRNARITELTRRNLKGRDLRNADLFKARLEGANLSGARLDAANLSGARLEGASLWNADLVAANLVEAMLDGAGFWDANLERANLRETRLKRASLFGANLKGANLQDANMDGASLFDADLDRANLTGASMRGANFGGARLVGATLFRMITDDRTDFTGADLNYAAIKWVDLSSANISQLQVDSSFGDASVFIPSDLIRPDQPKQHWPKVDLDWSAFVTHWRDWQLSEGYAVIELTPQAFSSPPISITSTP